MASSDASTGAEPRSGPDAEPQQADENAKLAGSSGDEESGIIGAAKYSTAEEEVVTKEDRDPFDRDA
jgi:hypothetical protein